MLVCFLAERQIEEVNGAGLFVNLVRPKNDLAMAQDLLTPSVRAMPTARQTCETREDGASRLVSPVDPGVCTGDGARPVDSRALGDDLPRGKQLTGKRLRANE